MGIESTKNFLQGFIRFFNDNPPKFSRNFDTKTVTVAGRRIQYDDLNSIGKLFTPEIVINYDLNDWFKMTPTDRLVWFVNFIEGTYRSDGLERQKQKQRLRESMKEAQYDVPDTHYILERLQPCRVVGDCRKEAGFKFLDKKTGKLTEYDFHAIHWALSRDLDKDSISEYLLGAIHIKDEYIPHEKSEIELIEDSNNVYRINRYDPPAWRFNYDLKPHMEESFEKLFLHLFPEERCRQFVYTWIYHSLTSRAGTYLYLCGGQGSGKNTLATLLTALHGYENSSNAKQDSLKARFNYYLKDKTFIFFDEFNCRTRQDKDILKSIINKRIQIEGKGRDHEDIEIHASYIIANNSLEAIGLDPVDRRFSVPKINNGSIIAAYDRKFMRDLCADIEDPEKVGRFGKWILENFKDFEWTSEEPYQTERFEEIVLATARVGIQDMVHKVLEKTQEEYDYNWERRSFQRTNTGPGKYPSLLDWQAFWREVKKDGEPLGKVDGPIFKPDDRFMPEDAHG